MTASNCSKPQHPEKRGLITTAIIVPRLTPLLPLETQKAPPAKNRLKLFDSTPFSVEFLRQHVPANDAIYHIQALQA